MTGRERVLLALGHREADRVPIDLGAMRSTGIAAIAYDRLVRELGTGEGPCRMYDFQQQLAWPSEAVRRRFGVDAVDAGQAFLEDPGEWREWTLPDGSPCLVPRYVRLETDAAGTARVLNGRGEAVAVKPRTSLYADQAHWPWRELPGIPDPVTREELSRHSWGAPCPPSHLDWGGDDAALDELARGVRRLRETTDCAVMISAGASLFETGGHLRGIDNFLVDLYTDPAGVERLLDRLTETHLERLERLLGAAGDLADIVQFGDDLGTMNGPWMAPEVFRGVFIPRYRKMWRFVHERSSCRVFLHSCGAVAELIPDLIGAGLDILNPVQTSARGMEPERLKREFGPDLVFWGGGCDTREVLPRGTPEQVREDVRRRIEVLGRDGGFVFCAVHNILADVPPRNIVAMYDAALELGRY